MPESLVLQKLLTGAVASAIVEDGLDQVGGYVASAAEIARLTPAELLAAYGIDGDPEFVDVVRFHPPSLATFSTPSSDERPWQTFPNGFLLGESLARVWHMSRTRYPWGSEYWRIRSDGQQARLSHYGGAARGWVRAQRWQPPSPIVGTLAKWRGNEFLADVSGADVQLTAIADAAPPGFEQVRQGAWSAVVPLSECVVFERVFTADLDGIPVRLLRHGGGRAHLSLLSGDPSAAERVGASLIEPAVYEVVVDARLLKDVKGVENQLAPQN